MDHAQSDESSFPQLMLFVTGGAPRSHRARANLSRALDELGLSDIEPLEVDLLEQPEQTITYSVFATPALLRVDEDGGVHVLYGDLTNETTLRNFLGDLAA